MNKLVKTAEVPLTEPLANRLSEIGKLDPIEVTPELVTQARDLCEGLLCDVDVKQVKVHNGRETRETVRGYLEEIPSDAIVRVAEIVAQASQGVRWTKICGGRAFTFIQWMAIRYPVITHLREVCERQRGEARASKALDTLDGIAEEAEQDGARVKACELTLRAHHSAFGAKTAEKVGSSRPIIVVNIDNIYGSTAPADVVDAQI